MQEGGSDSPVTSALFRPLAATGNGWCELYLNISAVDDGQDEDALYGAGFAEGALTVQQIWDYYNGRCGEVVEMER